MTLKQWSNEAMNDYTFLSWPFWVRDIQRHIFLPTKMHRAKAALSAICCLGKFDQSCMQLKDAKKQFQHFSCQKGFLHAFTGDLTWILAILPAMSRYKQTCLTLRDGGLWMLPSHFKHRRYLSTPEMRYFLRLIQASKKSKKQKQLGIQQFISQGFEFFGLIRPHVCCANWKT